MANNDREAWVQAQAEALYQDLCAREAAQAAAAQEDNSTTVVEGTRYGITGGTVHGDIYFN